MVSFQKNHYHLNHISYAYIGIYKTCYILPTLLSYVHVSEKRTRDDQTPGYLRPIYTMPTTNNLCERSPDSQTYIEIIWITSHCSLSHHQLWHTWYYMKALNQQDTRLLPTTTKNWNLKMACIYVSWNSDLLRIFTGRLKRESLLHMHENERAKIKP